MAFDKYKDGAWQEPEESARKNVDGAWVDCDSAKRYKDGAWTEVWANTKLLYQLQRPPEGKGSSVVSQSEWGDYTTLYTDDGYGQEDQTFIYVADGEWTNPTFSAFAEAERDPETSNDSVCALYAYGITTDGKVVCGDGSNNTNGLEPNFLPNESKQLEFTLEGQFVKFGFVYVGQYMDSTEMHICRIKEIRINGQKYITDSSYDY